MFDVVIPTYNNLSELKKCLFAFDIQTYEKFRVLVCVDGSNDGTLDFLNKQTFNFELTTLNHPGGEHRGRSSTRNLAIKEVKSEYVLIIDSDAEAAPDLLENHLKILSMKDCVSAGEIIYKNVKQNIWAAYISSRGKSQYENGAIIPAKYFTSGNVSFRAKYFLEAGGFDPDFDERYGGEDTDFGIRLFEKFRVPLIYNKSAVAYSEMTKSLDFAIDQLEDFSSTNLKLLLIKHPENKDIFNFGFVRGSVVKKYLIKILASKVSVESLKTLTKILPRFLSLKFVHLLTMIKIFKNLV